jgi:hypothetical protein
MIKAISFVAATAFIALPSVSASDQRNGKIPRVPKAP